MVSKRSIIKDYLKKSNTNRDAILLKRDHRFLKARCARARVPTEQGARAIGAPAIRAPAIRARAIRATKNLQFPTSQTRTDMRG